MKVRIFPMVLVALTVASLARGVESADTGPRDLGGSGAADSLRTNVWLVEALMGEIVAQSVSVLPPPPGSVLLVNRGTEKSDGLLRIVAARVLRGQGYDVLVDDPDSTAGAAADYLATFSVNQTELAYPDVGRTMGLWRSWVRRDLTVAATVEISETRSGRMLLSERLARRFTDRVTDKELPQVESGLYPFTRASIGETGWQRRLEEIAVIGTMAGLVAVYFANTGD